ncbi:MAG: OsmC family protein [Chitinophagaceae bacterium]
MAQIHLQLIQKPYGFIATDEAGLSVKMDNIGTQIPNFGVSPMQMLLMALAGCSSIDVMMILQKQKQEVETYQVTINATKETFGDFSLWVNIDIEFTIKGNVDIAKANRAVELSINKYCSVAETLRRSGATINYIVAVI